MIDPKKIKKVGIIGVSTIGDMVINIPFFKLARDTFPNAKIYFLSGTYVGLKLIENCPYIDGIISEDPKSSIYQKLNFILKIRKEKFDVVLMPWGFNLAFLTGFISGAKYRVAFDKNRYGYDKQKKLGKFLSNTIVDYKYNRFLSDTKNTQYDGIKYIQEILSPFVENIKFNENLELFMDYKKEETNVEKILPQNNIGKKDKIICVHLGGMKANMDRAWERENWVEVFKFIIKSYPGTKLCFIGGEDNTKEVGLIINSVGNKGKLIDFTQKLTLHQSTYLINKSHLFLCTDSGPMHIALGLNKKVIALLGPVTHVIDKYIHYPIRKTQIPDITVDEVIDAIKSCI